MSISITRTAEGAIVLAVTDRGIGMSPIDLADANSRLAHPGEADSTTTRHMGLFVVSKLAALHRITVLLSRTFDTERNAGITASVNLPITLIVAPANLDPLSAAAHPAAQNRTSQLVEKAHPLQEMTAPPTSNPQVLGVRPLPQRQPDAPPSAPAAYAPPENRALPTEIVTGSWSTPAPTGDRTVEHQKSSATQSECSIDENSRWERVIIGGVMPQSGRR